MSPGGSLFRRIALPVALAAAAALVAPLGLQASSHREAPGITERPKVDGTDFYAFRSYESGREAFVTLVADYIPLQDPYGGPNYFALDPRARYEIKIDNDGDARENTDTLPKAAGSQNNLGVIAGDVSGFPNGRRPGDDVVDIALRVVMGKLLPLPVAPSGQLPFTDGALVDASHFASTFPYLKTPIGGSPNDTP